jgi:hypothetical protein
LCAAVDFEWERVLDAQLPLSRYTVSKPNVQMAEACGRARAGNFADLEHGGARRTDCRLKTDARTMTRLP